MGAAAVFWPCSYGWARAIWTWAQPMDPFQWSPVAAPWYPERVWLVADRPVILCKRQQFSRRCKKSCLPPLPPGQHTPAWCYVLTTTSACPLIPSHLSTPKSFLWHLRQPQLIYIFSLLYSFFCELRLWKIPGGWNAWFDQRTGANNRTSALICARLSLGRRAEITNYGAVDLVTNDYSHQSCLLQRILTTGSIKSWQVPARGSFHIIKPETCTLMLISQATQGCSPVKVIDGTCQLLVFSSSPLLLEQRCQFKCHLRKRTEHRKQNQVWFDDG